MPIPYGSDDLTLKVWETESVGTQSGGGFAPWLVLHKFLLFAPFLH